jgi:hypothetical protein
MLGSILTLDNLRNLEKRHLKVMDWCCMCMNNWESIDHLWLYFIVARELCVSVFRHFGVEWVMLNRVVVLLASWSGQFGCHCYLEAWKMAPLCLM